MCLYQGRFFIILTILVDVPLGAVTTLNVYISINESDTLEVLGSFDCRPVIRITNELGVVVLDDGGRNDVCAWREVDDGA